MHRQIVYNIKKKVHYFTTLQNTCFLTLFLFPIYFTLTHNATYTFLHKKRLNLYYVELIPSAPHATEKNMAVFFPSL